ncbi:SalD [Sulfurifustis variabilis]|uniref:SalD n=1 Tax=Sulfurifustis variabilis TaxID=1675686 RepID=A0A1B4V7N6_9GAMM|nr:SalD [Sulfurifustis variabilis]
MQHKKKYGLALAIAAAVAAPSAFATNGYFSHGYSIKEKGLVGAGVALPQDSLAAATNPAGMVRVGNRIDAGLSLFSPKRSYTVEGAPSGTPPPAAFGLFPETVDSDSELFFIASRQRGSRPSERSASRVIPITSPITATTARPASA